jgi:hypothetical protein
VTNPKDPPRYSKPIQWGHITGVAFHPSDAQQLVAGSGLTVGTQNYYVLSLKVQIGEVTWTNPPALKEQSWVLGFLDEEQFLVVGFKTGCVQPCLVDKNAPPGPILAQCKLFDSLGKPILPWDKLAWNRNQVSFSAKAKKFAGRDKAGNLQTWDLTQKQSWPPIKLKDLPDGIDVIALSPDGDLVAVAGGRAGGPVTEVSFWETATATRRPEKFQLEPEVTCMLWTPKGDHLILGTRDGELQLWHRLSGTRVSRKQAHTGPVSCGVFSSDGKLLATGGADKMVQLWSWNQ